MLLKLERFKFTDKSTIGKLSVNGLFFAYTLEDVDRELENGGEKIFAQTAIPRGTYKVIIDYSNRFKREMPRLLSVPQFEGIRIHNGKQNTTAEDTSGCILVGSSYGEDCLQNSRATFIHLMNILEEFYDKGIPLEIEVT